MNAPILTGFLNTAHLHVDELEWPLNCTGLGGVGQNLDIYQGNRMKKITKNPSLLK